jgi:hypothetical protein
MTGPRKLHNEELHKLFPTPNRSLLGSSNQVYNGQKVGRWEKVHIWSKTMKERDHYEEKEIHETASLELMQYYYTFLTIKMYIK